MFPTPYYADYRGGVAWQSALENRARSSAAKLGPLGTGWPVRFLFRARNGAPVALSSAMTSGPAGSKIKRFSGGANRAGEPRGTRPTTRFHHRTLFCHISQTRPLSTLITMQTGESPVSGDSAGLTRRAYRPVRCDATANKHANNNSVIMRTYFRKSAAIVTPG